jgi:hypothetical protein
MDTGKAGPVEDHQRIEEDRLQEDDPVARPLSIANRFRMLKTVSDACCKVKSELQQYFRNL